jgi:hypothetical protein
LQKEPATTESSAAPKSGAPATTGASHVNTHSLRQLQADIAQAAEDADVLVLGVMTPAGAYPELSEHRMRMRVALLEGLGVRGFEPMDTEHVGYFSLPWTWQQFDRPGEAADKALREQINNDERKYNPLIIPYEWCGISAVQMASTAVPDTQPTAAPSNGKKKRSRKPSAGAALSEAPSTAPAAPASNTAAASQPASKPVTRVRHVTTTQATATTQAVLPGSVLVLWLPEEAMQDLPLTRLGAVLEAIKKMNPAPKKRVLTKIIGPRTSSTLRQMVAEAWNGLEDRTKQALQGLTMYAATPTAEDGILLHDLPYYNLAGQETVPAFFKRMCSRNSGKEPTLSFVRTTVDDRAMSDALVDELELRGIHVRPTAKAAGDECDEEKPRKPEKLDEVAVVAEWDTFYGRALPYSFASAMLRDNGGPDLVQALLGSNSTIFPKNLHPFVYLRGLDGITAAETAAAAKKNAGDSTEKSQQQQQALKTGAPTEVPEGQNQSDYLRRLADQLANLNESLHAKGRSLRAVGVLGTDVYDKLLVLRALRDRLPGVVFFTTGLDARYSLPGEWSATHNLVVTSPFGLRLHRVRQRNIPPFRDSDQTAMFSASLVALGETVPKVVDPPRRYEVSRNGPWDLTVDTQNKERLSAKTASELPENLGQSANFLHPPRYDLGHWTFQMTILGAILVLLALLLVPVFVLGVRPANIEWWRVAATGLVPLVGVAGIFLGLFLLRNSLGMTDEPLGVFDGISVWPTEVVRALAAVLSVHFIIEGLAKTKQNNQDLGKWFNLELKVPQNPDPNYPEAKLEPDPPAPQQQAHHQGAAGNQPQAPQPPTANWDYLRPPQAPKWYWRWRLDKWFVYGGDKVYAQNLWWEYLARGRIGPRLARFITMSLLYIWLAYFIAGLLPMPQAPIRGEWATSVDKWCLRVSVAASVLLTFYVLDSTYLNKRFIDHLTRTDTQWPKRAFTHYGCLTPADVREYLDIRLIAMRTQVVGGVIYYPFFIFFLMLLGRNALFDDWSWPIGLLFVLFMNLTLAVMGALMLRDSAEVARNQAVEKLRGRMLVYHGQNQGEIARALEKITTLVERERQGAFSLLSQHPFLAAILLPSSGLGLWALIEYAARTMR